MRHSLKTYDFFPPLSSKQPAATNTEAFLQPGTSYQARHLNQGDAAISLNTTTTLTHLIQLHLKPLQQASWYSPSCFLTVQG